MAELVAKTAAAIAVTDEPTTLLDWTNIEQVSDFTLIVENVDTNESGYDIVGVQIDTSDDGGATFNLDQHKDLIATPILPKTAHAGDFTETAKFVRVQAERLMSKPTTAEAILLADSAVPRICTLADVKDRLGLEGTDFDVLINSIVAGIEGIFNGYCRRELLVTAADVTDYYTAENPGRLLARCYPIISVTSIKESYNYDFDAAAALTENTDYRLVRAGKNGIIYRVCPPWCSAEDGIQIVYRGGYCSAGQTPGDGEHALPADLREAAILQASFIFKRKDDIGLTAVSFEGGSISKFSAMKLLPMVEETLKKYRRPQL